MAMINYTFILPKQNKNQAKQRVEVKVIDDIVLYNVAVGEELRNFQSTNGIYEPDRLRPLGCLVPDIAIQEKENLKPQRQSR